MQRIKIIPPKKEKYGVKPSNHLNSSKVDHKTNSMVDHKKVMVDHKKVMVDHSEDSMVDHKNNDQKVMVDHKNPVVLSVKIHNSDLLSIIEDIMSKEDLTKYGLLQEALRLFLVSRGVGDEDIVWGTSHRARKKI